MAVYAPRTQRYKILDIDGALVRVSESVLFEEYLNNSEIKKYVCTARVYSN